MFLSERTFAINEIDFVSNVSEYCDSAGIKDFRDISKIDFVKLNQTNLNYGFSNFTHWVKIDLLKQEEPVNLKIENYYLDNVEIFYIHNGDTIHLKSGLNSIQENRKFRSKDLVFQIQPDVKIVYIKVVSNTMIFLPIQLVAIDEYHNQSSLELIAFSSLHIIILFVMLYHLTLFVKLRNNIYLYYSAYLLALFLTGISITGYGQQFIWGNSLIFNRYAPILSNVLLLVSFCLFSSQILSLKRHLPKIRITLLSISFFSVTAVPFVFIVDLSISIITFNMLPILAMLLSTIASIFMIRKKYAPAKYYLIGWTIFMIGSISMQLRNLGILPSNFITSNLSFIGAIIEILFFSLSITALVKRINKILNMQKLKSLNM